MCVERDHLKRIKMKTAKASIYSNAIFRFPFILFISHDFLFSSSLSPFPALSSSPVGLAVFLARIYDLLN